LEANVEALAIDFNDKVGRTRVKQWQESVKQWQERVKRWSDAYISTTEALD